jgi:DNA polymerase-3 subunit gamma/tau
MSEPLQWALKYRPQDFGDFSGQRPSVAVLYRMCQRGTVPNALLFHGERGCGKTSMARVTAKALNCRAKPGKADEWPCNACPSCLAITAGTSPDVTEIDAASHGNVDSIRELILKSSYGTAGEYRVYIIDEAHGISGPGFEEFLKTLEEPSSAQTVFIFCTTRPDKIPRPVRDRLLAGQFWFAPLSPEVIRRRLAVICAAEGFAAEPELLSAVAEAADGGMRDAIMRLDQLASVGITTVAMWRQLTGQRDFAPELLGAAASADYPALFAVLDDALAGGDPGYVAGQLIRTLADVLVLTTPGGKTGHAGQALAARTALAERLGAARATAALQVLWELQAKVRTGDPKADLILAASQIARRMNPQSAAVRPIAPGTDSREAISQLRHVLGAPTHAGPD